MGVGLWKFGLCVLIILCFEYTGWYMFGKGFFPVKETLPGISRSSDMKPLIFQQPSAPPTYDRTILLVIDAFRADFPFAISLGDSATSSHEMPFLQELITQKKALPFIGKAQAPTVTLPRIKALVSGSVPSFWDFIDNFHSPSLQDDSLLHQLREHQWKTCFYGDDTWLKLFPPKDNFFLRYEGTTSFFVADTVEVDHNVTRNLHKEIELDALGDSYDALILHYLGLDHIGHSKGPQSPLIGPKLLEMDNIIRLVYHHAVSTDSTRCINNKVPCGTLFIVTGDHGMNELGNHGGSSIKEVSTGLIVIDPARKNNPYKTNSILSVNQVDIIPSLSILLGFPLPLNNIGCLIPSLFSTYSSEQLLRAYQLNAEQLIRVIQANKLFWHAEFGPQTKDVVLLWKQYQDLQHKIEFLFQQHSPLEDKESIVVSLLEDFSQLVLSMSEVFVKLLTEYDTFSLISGIGLLSISCFLTVILGFVNWYPLWKHVLSSPSRRAELLIFFIGFMLFYGSLFTSSLVEEEHQTWYFLTTSILLLYTLFCCQSLPTGSSKNQILLSLITLLFLQKLLRSWNQTGVKWLDLSDIGDTLDLLVVPSVHIFLPFIYCLVVSILISLLAHQCGFVLCSSTVLFSCILFITKLSQIEDSLIETYISKEYINKAIQLVYLGIICQFIWIISLYFRRSKVDVLPMTRVPTMLLMLFLHKPRNQLFVILIAVHAHQLQSFLCLFHKSQPDEHVLFHVFRISFLSFWFGKTSYFWFGNSNHLAAIDISGAYTGLDSYNQFVVGLFAWIILYSGPIWYIIYSVGSILSLSPQQKHRGWLLAFYFVWMTAYCFTLLFFALVTFILRQHLFIWSVFSPKFLFESAHATSLLILSIFIFGLACTR